MMKLSLSDYIQDVLKDEEPVYLVDPDGDVDSLVCPGCDGRGRYVGLQSVEDPCQVCGGAGWVPADGARADSNPGSLE